MDTPLYRLPTDEELQAAIKFHNDWIEKSGAEVFAKTLVGMATGQDPEATKWFERSMVWAEKVMASTVKHMDCGPTEALGGNLLQLFFLGVLVGISMANSDSEWMREFTQK